MLAFVHLDRVWRCAHAREAGGTRSRAGVRRDRGRARARASSTRPKGSSCSNGSYDIGFTIDLALRDLALVLALGEDTGVPLDLARQVRDRFDEAAIRYGGTAWSPMVVKLLEDEVGADLRAAGFQRPSSPRPERRRGGAEELVGVRHTDTTHRAAPAQ